jgi:ferredoxin
MIRITLRDRRFTARGAPGLTLLEAALEDGAPIRHACRHADCGTCVVSVDDPEAALSPASEAERACLVRIGARAGCRLACQARLDRMPGELRVRLEAED